MTRVFPLAFVALGLVVASGCGVPEEIYKARTLELDKCRQELTRNEADLQAARNRLEEEAGARERAVTVETEYMKLKRDLNATERQLEELKRARVWSEQRTSVYRLLRERLQPLAKDNSVELVVRANRMLVTLPEAALFEPGRAELKPTGEAPLRAVATVLREIVDRDFLVAAHTDNVLVKGSPFRSNWELSTARAVAVVRFLQAEGVDPRRLGAAGFSEFDRLADNDTPEHRTQNRRVEIVVQPRKEELPTIDTREPKELPTTPPPIIAPPQAQTETQTGTEAEAEGSTSRAQRRAGSGTAAASSAEAAAASPAATRKGTRGPYAVASQPKPNDAGRAATPTTAW
jgi:chemotaxis protein MotB